MTKEAVVDAVATAVDVVGDQVETLERIPNLALNGTTRNQQIVILATTAGVALAVGAGVATLITRKHFKTKYERLYSDIAEAEIAIARERYRLMAKEGEENTLDALAERIDEEDTEADDPEAASQAEMIQAARDIAEEQNYTSYDKAGNAARESQAPKVRSTVPVKVNAFEIAEDVKDEFDLDTELEKKQRGEPYIIEEEEYLENESSYPQQELQWYEEDGVMADEQGRTMPNWENLLGADNLKFGYGVSDPGTVYIRNDQFNTEYGITKIEGRFAELVHGFQEPRQSAKHSRRFRADD